MKKLLLIAVLMLALVITAVACTETPADEETTTAAPETTVAEETTVEETTEEETTLEETTEEETTEEETTEEETTEEETLPYVTDATAVGKSYDTFFANGEMYFEQDGQADVKLGLQNNTVEFAAGEYCYSIGLRGWIGFSQPIAQFGYFINDGEFVFADEFKAPTEDAVLNAGGPNASRFQITVPMGELGGGTYQVGFLAKLEDGTVVLLNAILTVTFSDPYVKDTAAGGAMSYDTFFANGEMYFPQDGQAAVKLEMQNNTVEFADGAAHDSIALRGWIGFSQPIAQFGYFIDTYDFVYGDFKQATEDAVLGAGGPNASRFNITVPMADLEDGTYKVGFVAQLEDGTVVLLNAVLTIVIAPVEPVDVDLTTVTITGSYPALDNNVVILHYGSINLGEIDLSKYSKVTVTYATPTDELAPGMTDQYNATAKRVLLLNAPSAVQEGTAFEYLPADEAIIATAHYEMSATNGAFTTVEIDLTEVDYNGQVYLSFDYRNANNEFGATAYLVWVAGITLS